MSEKIVMNNRESIENLENELGWYKIFVSREKCQLLLEKLGMNENPDNFDIEKKKVENIGCLYCIYVGKSSKLKNRLKEHFGYSKESTTLKTSLSAVLQNDAHNFMGDAYFEYGYKSDFKDGEYLCVWEAQEINKCVRILNIDCNENKNAEPFIEKLTTLRNNQICLSGAEQTAKRLMA